MESSGILHKIDISTETSYQMSINEVDKDYLERKLSILSSFDPFDLLSIKVDSYSTASEIVGSLILCSREKVTLQSSGLKFH